MHITVVRAQVCRHAVPVVAILALLVGFAPAAATQPVPPCVKDIAYAGYHPDLLMDWYPAIDAPDITPVVIYVHGGSPQTGGDKDDVQQAQLDILWLMVTHGISVMSINYRPYPDFVYPAQRDDVGRAVQHVRFHADTYGVDPERVILWGQSGGSIMSGWVTYGEDLADPLGTPEEQLSSRPLAWINFAALTDWTLMVPWYPAFFFGYPTLFDVPAPFLFQVSIDHMVCDVPRTYTPPVCSRYGQNTGVPPYDDPHDPGMMEALHGMLRQCYPEVAVESLQLRRVVLPPEVNNRLIVQWTMQQFGMVPTLIGPWGAK